MKAIVFATVEEEPLFARHKLNTLRNQCDRAGAMVSRAISYQDQASYDTAIAQYREAKKAYLELHEKMVNAGLIWGNPYSSLAYNYPI